MSVWDNILGGFGNLGATINGAQNVGAMRGMLANGGKIGWATGPNGEQSFEMGGGGSGGGGSGGGGYAAPYGAGTNMYGGAEGDPFGRSNPWNYNSQARNAQTGQALPGAYLKGLQAMNGEALRQQQALSRGMAGQELQNQQNRDAYTIPRDQQNAIWQRNFNAGSANQMGNIQNALFYNKLPGMQSLLSSLFGMGGAGGPGGFTQIPTNFNTNFGLSGGLTS